MNFQKQPVFRSEAWRRKVASLPCICCKAEPPTQAAHINSRGKATGMKAPDCWTMPLCPTCHREFDQGTRWTKQEKRELADLWVLLTVLDLASQGMVKA